MRKYPNRKCINVSKYHENMPYKENSVKNAGEKFANVHEIFDCKAVQKRANPVDLKIIM